MLKQRKLEVDPYRINPLTTCQRRKLNKCDLSNVNSSNISINHIEGCNIQLTDLSSRNPVECTNNICQVCQFVGEQMHISVHRVTVEEIEKGEAKMPFCNMNSWKIAHKADKDLNRVYSQLVSGTRPGKHRKYLIHRKRLYGNDFELVIVPQNLAAGLIP